MDDRRQRLAERGYNLVALMVIVSVLVILLGMAIPSFELGLKREREEEAIFRGLQIAEAIRVFQLRQGRLPVRLEELLEVEPRAIRQLWKDPLTEDGVWGLVRGASLRTPGSDPPDGEDDTDGESGEAGESREDDEENGTDEDGEGAGGGLGSAFSLGAEEPEVAAAIGPISGVFSRARGVATILFAGEEFYQKWRFTPELLPKPIVGAAGDIVTRANAATVGRRFLYGLAPAGLSALEPEELTPSGGALDVFGDDEEEGAGGGLGDGFDDSEGEEEDEDEADEDEDDAEEYR